MENKTKILIKNRVWWHVRKYYKSGHGALIVGESSEKDDGDYYFLNITKHPPAGYSYFETKEPINKSKEKSYVRLYLQKGNKKRFSKWLMKFELTEEDYKRIEDYLNEKKR